MTGTDQILAFGAPHPTLCLALILLVVIVVVAWETR